MLGRGVVWFVTIASLIIDATVDCSPILLGISGCGLLSC